MTLISPPLLSQHPSIPHQKVISPSCSDWISLLFNLSLTFPPHKPYHLTDSYWCACNGPHVSRPALWRNTFTVFFSGVHLLPLLLPLAVSNMSLRFIFLFFLLNRDWPFWVEYFFVSVFWLCALSFWLLLSESCLTQPRERDKRRECTIHVFETVSLISLRRH